MKNLLRSLLLLSILLFCASVNTEAQTAFRLFSGTFAQRPISCVAADVYWSTNTSHFYIGAGAPCSWIDFGAGGGGAGTVTSVSVTTANGFSGTVANATTTPAITLSTSVTGLLKGNGTSISAATAGTDYAGIGTANVFTAQQTAQGLTTTSPGWYTQITGDSVPRVRVGLNATDVPSIAFGPGNAVRDAFIERVAGANLRFGAPDAAAPVPQVRSVQNVVAGTSNTAGADTTYRGSQSTGTGVGGGHYFDVSPPGSTGTSQNPLVHALGINGAAQVSIGLGVTAPPAGPLLIVGDTITSSPRGIMSWQSNTGTDGARLHLRKSRGTFASPTVVVTGDTLGKVVATGYDGTNYLEMGTIEVQATGTIASTRVPTKMIFSAATNATPSVLTAVATLTASPSAASNGSLTLPKGSVSAPALNLLGSFNLSAASAGYLDFSYDGATSATFTVESATNGRLFLTQQAGIVFGASTTATLSGGATSGLYGDGTGLTATNGTAGQWSYLKAGTRDSGTTTVTNGLTIGHQSTGTPAAGLGTRVQANINDSTTADVDAGGISWKWTDATHATKTSQADIYTATGGAASTSVASFTNVLTTLPANLTIVGATVTLSNAGFTTCTALTTVANVLTCTVSTKQVKQNFTRWSSGLDVLRKIQPQTFSYRAGTQYFDGGKTHLGFIAENLKDANPLLASMTGPNGTGLMQPEQLAIQAATVSAVKELDAQIQELKKIVDQQQKIIQQLQRKQQ